jgi:2-keto-4-pentenoate hydratase/2-oxohepta-3-ene-1,7-dioic acid hydratase in catechol pathway
MKLVTYQIAEELPRIGAVVSRPDGDIIIDLAIAAHSSGALGHGHGTPEEFASMQALLAAGQEGMQLAAAGLRYVQEQSFEDGRCCFPASTAQLHAPIPRPGKILALAGNYRAHRAEGGTPSADPPLPEVFCKPVTSVIGPDDAIRLPGPPIVAVDYEGELGVVIGRSCTRVTEEEAMAYVAGYLCLNDISGRKLDPGFERPPELAARAKFFDWLIGKWCDTFCPIGPWLVTADEVPDPAALTLVTRVNGEERQRTVTGEMIHSIARTIAWCSSLMTLEPGDVIATGTPAGVGSASGRFLQPGDSVEVEITGLGILRNQVANS